MRLSNRCTAVGVISLLLSGACIGLTGCYSGDTTSAEQTSTPATTASVPLEEALASLDGAPGDATRIARFRTLLDQMDEKFTESRQEISDMTVHTQNKLKESGISQDLLSIMEGLNSLFSTGTRGMRYAEYAAAYIVLRQKESR